MDWIGPGIGISAGLAIILNYFLMGEWAKEREKMYKRAGWKGTMNPDHHDSASRPKGEKFSPDSNRLKPEFSPSAAWRVVEETSSWKVMMMDSQSSDVDKDTR